MKKIILTSILLLFISTAIAGETLCPVKENQPWDKMKESDFSKEKAKIQLEKLQKYFDGEIIVAEEFIYQSLLIIEGSALRQSVNYWKLENNIENVKYSTEQFCKFFKNAYLVH